MKRHELILLMNHRLNRWCDLSMVLICHLLIKTDSHSSSDKYFVRKVQNENQETLISDSFVTISCIMLHGSLTSDLSVWRMFVVRSIRNTGSDDSDSALMTIRFVPLSLLLPSRVFHSSPLDPVCLLTTPQEVNSSFLIFFPHPPRVPLIISSVPILSLTFLSTTLTIRIVISLLFSHSPPNGVT